MTAANMGAAPILAVMTDTNGIPVNPTAARTGAGNLAVNQITVNATATLVAAARTGRTSVQITNTGTTVCYVGPTAGVTLVNGDYLAGAAGAAKSYSYSGAIYAIATTGTQVVTVSELF